MIHASLEFRAAEPIFWLLGAMAGLGDRGTAEVGYGRAVDFTAQAEPLLALVNSFERAEFDSETAQFMRAAGLVSKTAQRLCSTRRYAGPFPWEAV